jgi:hypothetical protein
MYLRSPGSHKVTTRSCNLAKISWFSTLELMLHSRRYLRPNHHARRLNSKICENEVVKKLRQRLRSDTLGFRKTKAGLAGPTQGQYKYNMRLLLCSESELKAATLHSLFLCCYHYIRIFLLISGPHVHDQLQADG